MQKRQILRKKKLPQNQVATEIFEKDICYHYFHNPNFNHNRKKPNLSKYGTNK